MGATCFQSMPQGGMLAAVKRSIEWGGRKIVASNVVGSVLYAAVKMPDGQVVGVVGLIEGLCYKLMAECEGPYYYGAAPEVLAVLSATDDPWSSKWRMKCADTRLNAGAL